MKMENKPVFDFIALKKQSAIRLMKGETLVGEEGLYPHIKHLLLLILLLSIPTYLPAQWSTLPVPPANRYDDVFFRALLITIKKGNDNYYNELTINMDN